jgi:hypothetical protein
MKPEWGMDRMILKYHPITGYDLMRSLPWVPDNARRVVIDIPADDIVTVYMELIADVDEITVNALAGLTGGEVVTVSPKAAEAQPARKAPDTSSKTDRRQGYHPADSARPLDTSNPPSDFTAICKPGKGK